MRGRQPALVPGCAGIAEELAALIGHGEVCEGCALKAHMVQRPAMAAVAKPSQQPRTESCVGGWQHRLRSVDREIVGRNANEWSN
jgi:hypothetical protein